MNNNLLGSNLMSNQDGSRFVVLMDEVDGMSGDKGGMGALMEMIKNARLPVICIANEYSQKMKTLYHSSKVIKYSRPRPELLIKMILNIC